MNAVFISAVGLAAPGLDSWERGQPTLRGARPYETTDFAPQMPRILPPNERRRATSLTRVALQAAWDALTPSDPRLALPDAVGLRTVFASSHGDATVTGRICRTLATKDRLISPTDFHNSVHNAPAGYWTIGTHSQAASSSVSLLDGTFSAGFLEALTTATTESAAVLLVAYDEPLPSPLGEAEHVTEPFAAALLLTPEEVPERAIRARVNLRGDAREDAMNDPGLENLRIGNPAARCLPLLRSLATAGNSSDGTSILPYLDDCRLEVTISE